MVEEQRIRRSSRPLTTPGVAGASIRYGINAYQDWIEAEGYPYCRGDLARSL